jgi:hypothetical protein
MSLRRKLKLNPLLKKLQRGGNFNTDEDNMLVSAWIEVSLDVVQGNEQKYKTYWKKEFVSTFTSTRPLDLTVIRTL